MSKTLSQIGILSLSLAFVLLACAGCKGKSPAKVPEKSRPVKMLTIEKASNVVSYSFAAQLIAKERADLAFQVSGTLIEYPISKGMKVKKGDLIGKLDPENFENKYQAALSEYKKAEINFNMMKDGFKNKVASEIEFETAKSQYYVALAELNLAKRARNDTKLIAPFDGIIVDEYVENYQEIQAKTVIATLNDMSYFQVQFDVPAKLMSMGSKFNEAGKLKSYVTFPELGSTRKYLIDTSKNTAEATLIADKQTQSFRVFALLKKPDDIVVLPRMGATVTIEMPNPQIIPEGAILVPNSAIVNRLNNKPFVWIVDPKTMRVAKRAVTMGEPIHNNKIVVLSGLKPGEIIVASGSNALHPNALVSKLTQIGGEELRD